jgi:hypothetical protein
VFLGPIGHDACVLASLRLCVLDHWRLEIGRDQVHFRGGLSGTFSSPAVNLGIEAFDDNNCPERGILHEVKVHNFVYLELFK